MSSSRKVVGRGTGKAEINIYIGNESKDIVSVIGSRLSQKKSSAKISSRNGVLSIRIESRDALALASSIEGVARQIRIIMEVMSLSKGGSS